mmetsp:Transcript_18231/g.51061  ORF Transcript_18231/g.51061 Transcript_18231/m.51061 type:complete len:162 (-) Transcript_18231:354-839(-)
MALSLHSAFHPFFADDTLPEMARALANSADLFGGPASSHRRPALDLIEQPTEYRLSADLPGLGEEDIKLEINQRVLTLSADKNEVHEVRGEDGTVKMATRKSRSFRRTVQLPEDVDVDNIAATMDKGVLSLVLPKIPATQPRRIAVTPGSCKPALAEQPAA